ncbi:MAG TPA: FAD-dependent monooxygenase [Anaeromyxobacter sp.]|nr:FAD-dependent monooxygenase [Anaeromyxobacter sp.]
MRILVSGAGIAGSAACSLLRASGHDVAVIDRAPAFRRLGYVLSLKSFGVEILRSMGLLADLRWFAIPLHTVRVHDGAGELVKDFPEDLWESATRESLFLLRSDLHRVLHAAASRAAPVRFGTEIRAIDLSGGGARVTFSDGGAEVFDLVLIAEGARSTTRRLVFGEAGLRPFDLVYAATMIEGPHPVPPGVYDVYLGPRAAVQLVPIDRERLVVQCYFRGVLEPEHQGERVRELLRNACRRFPPGIRALVERVSDHAYVFHDSVGLVSLPTLSRGRAVFLGDAGYCPTFLSGMGASLALLGAKGLEVALRENPDDLEAALCRLEELMRPAVAHYQEAATENVGLLLSKNPLRPVLQRWFLRHAPPASVARHLGHRHEVDAALLRPFGLPGAPATPPA